MAMETLEGGTHLDAVGLDGNEATAGQLGSSSRAIAGCGDIRLLGSHVCGFGFDVGSKVKELPLSGWLQDQEAVGACLSGLHRQGLRFTRPRQLTVSTVLKLLRVFVSAELPAMVTLQKTSAPRWTAVFLLWTALCCLFAPAGT
jgi:hypothetical protein